MKFGWSSFNYEPVESREQANFPLKYSIGTDRDIIVQKGREKEITSSKQFRNPAGETLQIPRLRSNPLWFAAFSWFL